MPAGRAPATSSGPYFPPPPGTQAPFRGRTARSDIYLPPMPEMLHPPASNGSPVLPKSAGLRSPTKTPDPAPMTPLYTKTPMPVPPKADAGAATIRAQTPDEKPSRPLQGQGKIVIPSAEELGLNDVGKLAKYPSDAQAFDWNTVKGQMKELGATHYRLENDADGSVRFVCAVPHPSDPNKHRQFEARANSEQDAYRLALEQANAWKQSLK